MNTLSIALSSFGITHVGLARDNNEDLFDSIEEKYYFALADGMGGHLAGEVAAALALQSVNRSVQEHLPLSLEKTCLFLREAIIRANLTVFQESIANEGKKGMGTTLSCFTLVDRHLVYGHIGDSRIYRYRNGLKQLTHDHCLKAKLHHSHPQYRRRHALTRAIGTQSRLLPDIGVIPVYVNDLYMLCTDGLSDYLSSSFIESVLGSSYSLQEKGQILLQSALEKGGRDNITLLLVHLLPCKQKFI